MSAVADWVDDRTGAVSAVRKRRNQPIPGGARFRYVLPATIVFGFLVQAITGLFLWMHYSPSAQTAWASIFHLQYNVQGG